MDDKDRDIELRSEKIRNIMGQMPPFLLRLNSLFAPFEQHCVNRYHNSFGRCFL